MTDLIVKESVFGCKKLTTSKRPNKQHKRATISTSFKREDPETWTKSLVYGPILVVVGLGMIGVGVAICVFARTSRELPFSSLTK